MSRITIGDVNVPAGERTRDDERGRLNAIRDDPVTRAMQFVDAFHADGRSSSTFDARAHAVQQIREVGNFRLASAILYHGFPVRQGRGHQQVFGSGYGDLFENNLSAAQTFCGCFHVAVILSNGCAQQLKALDMQVDRPPSDCAAAGKRDTGAAATSNQRSKYESGGAHGLHQLVGGLGRGKIFATDGRAMLGAAVSELNLRTHGRQKFARGLDIAHLRDVFKDDRFIRKQSGGHSWEGCVLSAANANSALQRISAANDEFVHIDIVRCENATLGIVKAKWVGAGRELPNRKGTACWRKDTMLLGRKKSSFARPWGRRDADARRIGRRQRPGERSRWSISKRAWPGRGSHWLAA